LAIEQPVVTQGPQEWVSSLKNRPKLFLRPSVHIQFSHIKLAARLPNPKSLDRGVKEENGLHKKLRESSSEESSWFPFSWTSLCAASTGGQREDDPAAHGPPRLKSVTTMGFF
jgi:hypothetical protein